MRNKKAKFKYFLKHLEEKYNSKIVRYHYVYDSQDDELDIFYMFNIEFENQTRINAEVHIDYYNAKNFGYIIEPFKPLPKYPYIKHH